MTSVVRGGAAVALLGTLALLVVGCGGKSSASPEKTWAGNFCTDLTTWQNHVKKSTNDAISTIRSPRSGALAAVQADVTPAVDATNTLVTQMKTLGPPDTDVGTEAQQQLNTFATELETTIMTVQSTVAIIPAGASFAEIEKKVTSLAPALESLETTTSKTVDTVQADNAALKDGFQKADSCQPYR